MVSDFNICPSCGERNIKGEDLCWNCLAPLNSMDIPETAQPISENALTRSLSNLRLRRPSTITPDQAISEAVAILRSDPAGAIVVLDGEKVVGIFTERDVLHRVALREGAMDEPIATVMTHEPECVDENDIMAVVLNRMGDGGFRHLPVVRAGELIGLVTATDVARWVLLNYFD